MSKFIGVCEAIGTLSPDGHARKVYDNFVHNLKDGATLVVKVQKLDDETLSTMVLDKNSGAILAVLRTPPGVS